MCVRRGSVCMVSGSTSTNALSLWEQIPAVGEVYSIQEYVIRNKYNTIETKETSRFGYDGFLYTHEYSDEGHDNNIVTRVTRRVPNMEQELLTHPTHMRAPPVFSEVRVARSSVFCVMLCRSLCVPLSPFFWLLYCLSFFGLRLLINYQHK